MLLFRFILICLYVYFGSLYSLMPNKIAHEIDILGPPVNVSQCSLPKVMSLEVSDAMFSKEPLDPYEQCIGRVVFENFFVWPAVSREAFNIFICFQLLHRLRTDHDVSSFRCLLFLKVNEAIALVIPVFDLLDATPR